jgi:hypothetical protein
VAAVAGRPRAWRLGVTVPAAQPPLGAELVETLPFDRLRVHEATFNDHVSARLFTELVLDIILPKCQTSAQPKAFRKRFERPGSPSIVYSGKRK